MQKFSVDDIDSVLNDKGQPSTGLTPPPAQENQPKAVSKAFSVDDVDSILKESTPQKKGFSVDDVDSILSAPSTGVDRVKELVSKYASQYGIDPEIAQGMAKQESGYRQTGNSGSTVTSPKGALGVMQLMPSTAQGLGVDPADMEQNIEGGMRYMSGLLKQYNGDYEKALAAYNAGAGNVDRYGGIPPFPETQNYVRSIMSLRSAANIPVTPQVRERDELISKLADKSLSPEQRQEMQSQLNAANAAVEQSQSGVDQGTGAVNAYEKALMVGQKGLDILHAPVKWGEAALEHLSPKGFDWQQYPEWVKDSPWLVGALEFTRGAGRDTAKEGIDFIADPVNWPFLLIGGPLGKLVRPALRAGIDGFFSLMMANNGYQGFRTAADGIKDGDSDEFFEGVKQMGMGIWFAAESGIGAKHQYELVKQVGKLDNLAIKSYSKPWFDLTAEQKADVMYKNASKPATSAEEASELHNAAKEMGLNVDNPKALAANREAMMKQGKDFQVPAFVDMDADSVADTIKVLRDAREQITARKKLQGEAAIEAVKYGEAQKRADETLANRPEKRPSSDEPLLVDGSENPLYMGDPAKKTPEEREFVRQKQKEEIAKQVLAEERRQQAVEKAHTDAATQLDELAYSKGFGNGEALAKEVQRSVANGGERDSVADKVLDLASSAGLSLESPEVPLRRANSFEPPPILGEKRSQGKTDILPAGIGESARPEPMPPVPAGYMRMYRGEVDMAKAKRDPLPQWVIDGAEKSGAREARGRWWTDKLDLAKWYKDDSGADGRIVYQDVPMDVAHDNVVSKHEGAKSFSKDPDNEFFLPREYVGKGREVPSHVYAEKIEPAEQAAGLARREAQVKEAGETVARSAEPLEALQAVQHAEARAHELRLQRESAERRLNEQKGEKTQAAGKPVTAIRGKSTTVEIPGDKGVSYPAHYAVVKVDDLTPSHNPTSWKQNDNAFQPRNNYGRADTQFEVTDQGRKINPARILTDNPTAENGPSIVRSDGLVAGGNRRAMIQAIAYRDGQGEMFYNELKAKVAQFGINPESLPSMADKPVLVRILDRDVNDRAEMSRIGDELNYTSAAGYSQAERAVAAAKYLTDNQFETVAGQMADNDWSVKDFVRNRAGFVKELMLESGMIQPTQRDVYLDKGELNDAGIKLFEQAVWGRVIPDATVISRMQSDMPSVFNKLNKSLSQLARIKAREDVWSFPVEVLPDSMRLLLKINSIRGELKEATPGWKESNSLVDLYLHPERFKGKTGLMDFGGGNTIREVENPVIEAQAKLLEESTNDVKQAYETYIKSAELGDEKNQGGFGFFEAPLPWDSFNTHISKPEGIEVKSEDWAGTRKAVKHEEPALPEKPVQIPDDARLPEQNEVEKTAAFQPIRPAADYGVDGTIDTLASEGMSVTEIVKRLRASGPKEVVALPIHDVARMVADRIREKPPVPRVDGKKDIIRDAGYDVIGDSYGGLGLEVAAKGKPENIVTIPRELVTDKASVQKYLDEHGLTKPTVELTKPEPTVDKELKSPPVGAKNYTDADLAAFKAKHNIPEVKSELVGAPPEAPKVEAKKEIAEPPKAPKALRVETPARELKSPPAANPLAEHWPTRYGKLPDVETDEGQAAIQKALKGLNGMLAKNETRGESEKNFEGVELAKKQIAGLEKFVKGPEVADITGRSTANVMAEVESLIHRDKPRRLLLEALADRGDATVNGIGLFDVRWKAEDGKKYVWEFSPVGTPFGEKQTVEEFNSKSKAYDDAVAKKRAEEEAEKQSRKKPKEATEKLAPPPSKEEKVEAKAEKLAPPPEKKVELKAPPEKKESKVETPKEEIGAPEITAIRREWAKIPKLTPEQKEATLAIWDAAAKANGQTLGEWVKKNIAGATYGKESDFVDSTGKALFQDAPKDVEANIRKAGGTSLGVWPGTDLVVFNDPIIGTTMAMKISEVDSPQAVTRHMQEARDKFSEAEAQKRAKSASTLFQEGFPADIRKQMTESLEQNNGEKKGATSWLSDGRAIIHAFESADVSTLLHETAHVFRKIMEPREMKIAERWLGVENGDWRKSHEEDFARGFEKYLKEGKSPVPEMKSVFAKFKEWLGEIYKGLTGKNNPLGVKLTDESRELFDSLLGGKKLEKPAEKAAEKHEFSSTQVNAPREVAAKVKEFGKEIADEDLAGKGREDRPHVTVRFGIKGDGSRDVAAELKNHEPFTATLGKTKIFPPSESSDGAAVVYVEVKAPELNKLHEAVGKATPVKESDFEYKPHMTLAYVKPEAASKYSGLDNLEGAKFEVKSVAFSDKERKMTEMPLGKPGVKAPEKLAPPPAAATELKSPPRGIFDSFLTPEEKQAREALQTSAAKTDQAAQAHAEDNYGIKNKLTTKDEAVAARQRLLDKFGKKDSGKVLYQEQLDPETRKDLETLGLFHFEAGARTLNALSKAVTEDVGGWAEPHMGDIYRQLKQAAERKAAAGDRDSAQKVLGVINSQQRALEPPARKSGIILTDAEPTPPPLDTARAGSKVETAGGIGKVIGTDQSGNVHVEFKNGDRAAYAADEVKEVQGGKNQNLDEGVPQRPGNRSPQGKAVHQERAGNDENDRTQNNRRAQQGAESATGQVAGVRGAGAEDQFRSQRESGNGSGAKRDAKELTRRLSAESGAPESPTASGVRALKDVKPIAVDAPVHENKRAPLYEKNDWVARLQHYGLPENAPIPTHSIDESTAKELRYPGQREMVEMAVSALKGQHDAFVLAPSTGTGKCLAPGTPILMHDGSIKKVQDVKVGDRLMGADSTPRNVLSLAHGTDEMYRVTPVKGEPYEVNRPHVLSLMMSGMRRFQKTGDIINLSIDEYLSKNKTFRHCAKGYRVAVDFPDQEITIDPYFLGLWLGDGTAVRSGITTPEPEVEKYIRDYADILGLIVHKSKYSGRCPEYTITSGTKKGPQNRNHLRVEMESLNLLRNKHIPLAYKANSRYVRLQVLAGIIDTDGYLDHGNSYDLVCKDKVLFDDILFLARSLGLAAYCAPCKKTCANNGKVGDYFRTSISGDIDMIPTRVARRKAAPRQQKKNVLVTGIKVEPIGVGEYYGFEIDGDHLFLLGDFTVTHNTFLLGAIMKEMRPDYGLLITKSRNLIGPGKGSAITVNGDHFDQEVIPLTAGMKTPPKKGVYAATYAFMRDNPDLANFNWNLVAADESGEARRWWDSQQGAMMKTLGQKADKMVYSSATPFHTALEVGYMDKLHLWDSQGFDRWAEKVGVTKDSEGNYQNAGDPRKLVKLREQLIERGQYVNLDKDMTGYHAQFGVVPLSDKQQLEMKNIQRAFTMALEYFNARGQRGLARGVLGNAVNFMKAYLERVRLPETIETMKKLDAKGFKVAAFSESRSAVNELYDFMKPADQAMNGAISRMLPKLPDVTQAMMDAFPNQMANFTGPYSAMREAEKTAFMNNDKKHIFATYGAGGIGVSLHDTDGNHPRAAVYLGMPWSGVMFDQAIGRPWRYGTKSDVHSIFMSSNAAPEIRLLVGKVAPRLESLRAIVSGVKEGDPLVQAMRDVDGALGYMMGGAQSSRLDSFTDKPANADVLHYKNLDIPTAESYKNRGMKDKTAYEKIPKDVDEDKPLFQQGVELQDQIAQREQALHPETQKMLDDADYLEKYSDAKDLEDEKSERRADEWVSDDLRKSAGLPPRMSGEPPSAAEIFGGAQIPPPGAAQVKDLAFPSLSVGAFKKGAPEAITAAASLPETAIRGFLSIVHTAPFVLGKFESSRPLAESLTKVEMEKRREEDSLLYDVKKDILKGFSPGSLEMSKIYHALGESQNPEKDLKVGDVAKVKLGFKKGLPVFESSPYTAKELRAAQRLRDEIYEPLINRAREVRPGTGYLRNYATVLHAMRDIQWAHPTLEGDKAKVLFSKDLPADLEAKFSPDMRQAFGLKETTPIAKEPYSPFVQKREGNPNIDHDISDVMETYIPSMLKVIHDTPAIFKGIEQVTAIDKKTQPMLREYAERYLRTYAGVPGEYKETYKAGYRLARKIVDANYNALLQFNPKFALLHLGKTLQDTYPMLGAKYTLQGIARVATSDGRELLARSGVLTDMPLPHNKFLKAGSQILHSTINATEVMNRGIAYLGALEKAKSDGLLGNPKEVGDITYKRLNELSQQGVDVSKALDAAYDAVVKTQFMYTPAYAKYFMKDHPIISQFHSFTIGQAELMSNTLSNYKTDPWRARRMLGLLALEAAGGIYGGNQALKRLFPYEFSVIPPTVLYAARTVKMVKNFIEGHGTQKQRSDEFDNWLKETGTNFIPGAGYTIRELTKPPEKTDIEKLMAQQRARDKALRDQYHLSPPPRR